MKSPIFKRLTIDDFKDGPTWLGRLFLVLNDFNQQTSALLDGNVSFGDNIVARRFTSTFRTSATYTTGDFEPIRFSWNGANLPNALLIVSVVRTDGTAFLGSVGTPSWVFSAGLVVKYIPGLANSTQYTVTFLVI